MTTAGGENEQAPVGRRSLVVQALPHGPRHPATSTPERLADSVRRTVSLDQRRGDPAEPQEVLASGRDLRTRVDRTSEVVDRVSFAATVAPTGVVVAIESDPPEPRLAGLVGGHVSKGLRRRVDDLLPDHCEGATLLHQLLDDLPMANLISSYGASREQEDFRLPPDAAASRWRWRPDTPARARRSRTRPMSRRVVGQPVTALRGMVAEGFTGTSTCTHLNDVLRSVAGATALASALDR